MHLGMLMECEYRAGATQQEAVAEAFELANIAEQGGFDALWLAERHFASPERAATGASGGLPSIASAPLIIASALAAKTSRIRIGIAVSLLPLAHPVRLAEETVTLDQVSGGRLEFGIGRSGFLTAYQGYNVPYDESRERFEECLQILQAAWTQDAFSFSGKHYQFEDVCVFPKPLQSPHPPLRIAATTQDTFPMVGRQGFPIFVGLRATDVPQTAAYIETYRAAWREAGHAGEGDVMIRIPVYVADTADAAYHEPQESTLSSYQRLAESYRRSALAPGTVATEERAARGERLKGTGYDELLANRLVYGTPEAVTKRLLEIREQLGLSGLIIEPNVGGRTPKELVQRSVRLFAEQVAPALRAA
jgi:alkanesulfonate monooxygenase SsuD/methylene tetrahydromethanopterin reductase-like flavin-dependent oxidoreductase (luciferase family)